ncbi:CDP-alcohol phosphatidyltransferase family protein [Deltaproteobacteria bacterium TL4]
MPKREYISQNVAALLVYGRPPLVFAGMLCALDVMLTSNPIVYTAGVLFLVISMSFDLVDGWFNARFRPQTKLSHLADRIMDKVVYSMIFPVVATGMMWRFHNSENHTKIELFHVIFVLILCVTVLIRDNFAHFMRNFALRKGQDEELKEITRLRTMIAAPVSAILYAYAFYVPDGPSSPVYSWISWLGNDIPQRGLFFIEIAFLVVNFGSVAGYCRKYGTYCLDELCLGDAVLRRRILSLFPNALTVMNAMMGMLAIFFAYQDRMREAYMILIGAALFDKLDGAVARKLGLTEPLPSANLNQKRYVSFGSVLDDISDGVSFCIAPAIISYILLSRVPDATIQQWPYGWIALMYALLGIGRLVYFTMDSTPIPGFFKGLPTPAAALFISAPFIMLNQAVQDSSTQLQYYWGLTCIVSILGTSLLMNAYPIRYIHLGRFMSRKPWFGKLTLILILTFVFTPYFGHIAFFYLLLYALSPLVTWKISPEIAARETKTKSRNNTLTL